MENHRKIFLIIKEIHRFKKFEFGRNPVWIISITIGYSIVFKCIFNYIFFIYIKLYYNKLWKDLLFQRFQYMEDFMHTKMGLTW